MVKGTNKKQHIITIRTALMLFHPAMPKNLRINPIEAYFLPYQKLHEFLEKPKPVR